MPSSEQLSDLSELLAIPSVSLAGGAPMRAAAEWVAARLAFAGGRVVESDGHPIVLGEMAGPPGAPTILVYGHYDVQPAGDEREWETPPFAPSVRDGRIYARGATDDKGPVFVALETARAFERAGGAPLNVRFLIEGEEEIGSPSLSGFLAAHADELAADVVVSADGAMWRPSEPSVSVAAKGLLALDLEVTGAATDLHSGRHGGAVQNPNHALARILASLHDADGRVAVPGFYAGVRPVALPEVAFDEEAYRREIGVPALFGEPGFSTLERLWTRPTLEVNGIEGGGSFTVIPRRAAAHVTCRLVPGQEPDAVLAAIERHVRDVAPPGVEVRVHAQPGAVPAYEIATDHPAVRAAVGALQHAYPGSEPLLVRIGGTLPAAVLFERELGLKTLLFSFSTADEQLHAPNEFFRLDRVDSGIDAWSDLWRRLSAMIHA
jgi:acetylornithine deacetylase/succinyl-diaminopimelate desuccinylase-like protein